jgi:hypothetical protein
MASGGLSKEALDDINGQLHLLKIIELLPQEIEKELTTLLQTEAQQREMRGIQDATRSTGIRK